MTSTKKFGCSEWSTPGPRPKAWRSDTGFGGDVLICSEKKCNRVARRLLNTRKTLLVPADITFNSANILFPGAAGEIFMGPS